MRLGLNMTEMYRRQITSDSENFNDNDTFASFGEFDNCDLIQVSFEEAKISITKLVSYVRKSLPTDEDLLQTLIAIEDHILNSVGVAIGHDVNQAHIPQPRFIPDSEVPDCETDQNKALHTIPECLSFKKSNYSCGIGVFTNQYLPENIIFGPFTGDIVKILDVKSQDAGIGIYWQTQASDGSVCFIDGQDLSKANWMRFVHCTDSMESHNLEAVYKDCQVYYRTTKSVISNAELIVCFQLDHVDEEVMISDADECVNEDLVIATINNPEELMYEQDVSEVMEQHDSNVVESIKKEIDNSDHGAQTQWQCLKCTKLFSTEDLYHRHLEELHSEEGVKSMTKAGQNSKRKKSSSKPRLFGINRKVTRKKNNLGDRAENASMDPVTGKYTCLTCGKVFPTCSMFLYHDRVHTGDKPYQCIHCGKCFRIASQLQMHLASHMRSEDRPYVCDECDKTFTQRSNLVRHQRLHTGFKPYNCTDCGKSFTDASTYKVHVMIHTGEMPHPCRICGQKYRTISNRNYHEKSHNKSGLDCEICGYPFPTKVKLKKHMKSHMDINLKDEISEGINRKDEISEEINLKDEISEEISLKDEISEEIHWKDEISEEINLKDETCEISEEINLKDEISEIATKSDFT